MLMQIQIGSSGKFQNVHTMTESTMQKTCVTTATTVRGKRKWPTLVDIRISHIIVTGCAKTATWLSTISRGRIRQARKFLLIVKLFQRNEMFNLF